MYIQGIDPTETFSSTNANSRRGLPFKLGQRGMDSNGYEYIFVEADEAVTQYAACVIAEDFGVEMVDTTSTAADAGQGKGVGVAQTALTSGYFGWIMVNGIGSCLGAASCVKYTELNSTATAGTLDDDATAGAEVINGIVFSVTLTGAAATACVINHPLVSRTL